MIIKSLSRKASQKGSFRQLVNYVARYSIEDNKSHIDKDEATIILRHNLRSKSIDKMIDEFVSNESFRLYKRKDSVALYHDILSFSPNSENHITDSKLKLIAKKFVELRGANCLNLVVAHCGKTSHTHLHAVTSGVQLNGRSSRVSKAQFKHIKLELERFQRERFPELSHSLIEHQPHQKALENRQRNFKKARQTNKDAILGFLEKAAIKAKSKEDFLIQFSKSKYEPYYRNDKLQGVKVEGQKYRFSTLGFATEQHSINWEKKQREEVSLAEIVRIREKENNERLIEHKQEGIVQEDKNDEQEILSEFTSIRRRTVQRDLMER